MCRIKHSSPWWALHIHGAAHSSSCGFVRAQDCSVTNLNQTLGPNTAQQLGMINSAPRFWPGLTDSEAGYCKADWIQNSEPNRVMLYNEGLNYFCSWKVLLLLAELWDRCSLLPQLGPPPQNQPGPPGSPQIWGLGRVCEADRLGGIGLQGAVC